MKRFSNLILCATLAGGAMAAQAGTTLHSADLPRISNGGTGFVGVTQSAGMPRVPAQAQWTAGGTSPVPMRAGEASTFVDGRPNVDPNTPMATHRVAMSGDRMHSEMGAESRAMGMGSGAPMTGFPAGSHMGWGTPK